jgi:hypothetical protein
MIPPFDEHGYQGNCKVWGRVHFSAERRSIQGRAMTENMDLTPSR